MPATRFTLTSANRPRPIGPVECFVGDFTTADGLESLGVVEGNARENITYRQNNFTLEELLGGVALDSDVLLDGARIIVPVVAGAEELWAKISAAGTKSGGNNAPVPAVETSVLLIDRRELDPATGTLSYAATVWAPAAPKNALWFPRAMVSHGDIGRQFQNGGKGIVEVTFTALQDLSQPAGMQVFWRGDPTTQGITTLEI